MRARFHVFLVISFFVVASLLTAETPALASPNGEVVKKTLDNGLTVIIKPEEGSGVVSIVALVKTGAAQESIQNAGIGNFVAQLLLASTRMSSAEEVAAVADMVGGNIGAQWHLDYTEIRAVTTTEMFNRAMRLIGEVLNHANFEQQWVEQVREDLLKRLEGDGQDLFEKAYSDLRDLLYMDNGYGRPSLGFERTIKLATPRDLKQFYEMYYVPNNIVLTIAGDVTVEQALDRAEKAFAGELPKQLPVDRGVPDESLSRSGYYASEEDIGMAYLLLGWLAPPVGSEDYPAMMVATTALGAGKGSLLFREVRQNRGIYDVGAMYPRLKYQSHVIAYVITDPFKFSIGDMRPKLVLEEVKNDMLQQVKKLKEQPLSDRDLRRAKGYTIGTYALSHQHLVDRAFLLGTLEAMGVGYEMDSRFADEIEEVTAEDIQRVAKKYFTNHAAVLLLPKTNSPPAGYNK